jgi:glycine/D-amino acid oxidase-like deaminating enzyme
MKITKAEWDKFWTALGPDWFFDDSDAPDDDKMKPDEVLSVTCGGLHWQGGCHAQPKEVPGVFTKAQVATIIEGGIHYSFSLTSAIKRWQKSQTHTIVSIELPKDKAYSLHMMAKNNGWKVL